MTELRIGTSAFTAAGCERAFSPPGTKAADYLTYYATKFNTVEVDSTFYRTPSAATVNGWERETPAGFIIAAEVPQTITPPAARSIPVDAWQASIPPKAVLILGHPRLSRVPEKQAVIVSGRCKHQLTMQLPLGRMSR